uniref:Uncharacterized protein n=1 Tax=Rhizophagus irregularis (strain DAOM 181602 / DAOM 197198 / MUCL 43194) TaxID=747089 RepID=U9T2T2_RHIID
MGSRRSTTSQKKSKERFKTLKAKRMTTTEFYTPRAVRFLDGSPEDEVLYLQGSLVNAHQRTINALWDAEDRVEELENHEVESISTLHRQIRKLRSENQALKNPRNLLRSRSNLPDNNNNNKKKNQNNFFFK